MRDLHRAPIAVDPSDRRVREDPQHGGDVVGRRRLAGEAGPGVGEQVTPEALRRLVEPHPVAVGHRVHPLPRLVEHDHRVGRRHDGRHDVGDLESVQAPFDRGPRQERAGRVVHQHVRHRRIESVQRPSGRGGPRLAAEHEPGDLLAAEQQARGVLVLLRRDHPHLGHAVDADERPHGVLQHRRLAERLELLRPPRIAARCPPRERPLRPAWTPSFVDFARPYWSRNRAEPCPRSGRRGRRIRESTSRPRARRRRRAARRRSLSRILVASFLAGTVAVAGLVVLAPKVVTGTPSLAKPGRPARQRDRRHHAASQLAAGAVLRLLRGDARPRQEDREAARRGHRGAGAEPVARHGLRGGGPGDPAAQGRRPGAQHAVRRDPHPHRRHRQARAARAGEPRGRPRPSNASLDFAWDPVETATRYRVQLDVRRLLQQRRASSPPTSRRPRSRVSTPPRRSSCASALWARTGPRARGRTILRTETIKPDDPQPLAVGTYNIRCHKLRWAAVGQPARRGRRLDRVARPRRRRPAGGPAVDAARRRHQPVPRPHAAARRAGGRLEAHRRADQRHARRPHHLQHPRGAPGQGGRDALRQPADRHEFRQRFYTWAIFTQRSSGKDFLFVNTHLDPRSVPVRLAQARQLAADTARLRGKLPAIVVGDLNASQFHVYGVHEALKSAGLRRAARHHARRRTAVGGRHGREAHQHPPQQLQQLRLAADQPASAHRLNGTFIDYIFSTPMRVLEYETVVDLDASGRFRGGPPSDHNMLRAVVGLP